MLSRIKDKIIERLRSPQLVGQFIRYLFTGGFAFLVDFGLFALFLYVFEWHYLLANLAGLLGGLAVNYYISIIWVFAKCNHNVKNKLAEIAIFSLVGFAGVGLNQLAMYIFVDYLQIMEMLSKMVAAVVVLIWNFALRKVLLFRGKQKEDA